MKVLLGGTFDPFHVGHEALLRAAATGSEVFIGLTDGAISKRARQIAPFESRAEVIQNFWRHKFPAIPLEIAPIMDGVGPAGTRPADAIVVSPETIRGAITINEIRAKNGLNSLQILEVPHTRSNDGLILSATRISKGDVDRTGSRLTPIRVAVGSANEAKLAGVREAFQALLPGLELEISGHNVRSSVPEQPIGTEETMRGAQARATNAREIARDADFSVGIEAGLVQAKSFDAQACHILDRDGLQSSGWGPAFSYPTWIRDRLSNEITVSDLVGPLAKDSRIGSTLGAIGYYTNGQLPRAELTAWAVRMALIPWVSPAKFFAKPTP